MGIVPSFITDCISDALRMMDEGKPVLSSRLDGVRGLLAQTEKERPDNWDFIVADTRNRHTNFEMSDEMRELLENGTPDERESALIWEDDYDTAIRWMEASRFEAKNYANTRFALRQQTRARLKREDEQERKRTGRNAFADDYYQKKCRAAPVEDLAEIVRPVLDTREERYDVATWALAELVRRATIHDKAHEAGRFAMPPSARPLLTPLYGPPANSKIKDPRYPIPVKIREAKDAEEIDGVRCRRPGRCHFHGI